MFSARAQPEEAGAAGSPGNDFLFEGELTRMDSALAPTLREGQVLSGFFTLDLGQRPPDEDASPDSARYPGVVQDGEFVFDVNHVIAYFGSWREGDGWLVLTRGDGSEERPADVYGLTLPMDGEPFGEDGWRPRWLQIWLQGEPQSMLSSLEVQNPPETVTSGWFRISFADTEGTTTATAEGPITYTGPEGEELSATEQIAQLEGVVADLSNRLEKAESETARLSEQLARADRRIGGLNQTIDVLITERRELQNEVERLEVTKTEPDEKLLERVAELEAQQVFLEESKEALTTINEELARSLKVREGELREARTAIDRLVAEREAGPDRAILEQAIPDSPHPYLAPGQHVSGSRTFSQTLLAPPSNPVSAEPSAEEPADPVQEPSPERIEESPEEDEVEKQTVRLRGPRKFRRGAR